jgi:chorismate mutase
MSPANQPLDRLRREIDSIDNALHQLVVKRGAIVEQVRAIKMDSGNIDSGSALRPGREATILRRLAAAHEGDFPIPALIAMWREMFSGTTHMQKPLTAAVHAPPGFEAAARLARDHYGGMANLLVVPTASACLRAILDGAAEVGVLPMPFDGDHRAWWPMLMGQDGKIPEIVSRLPFVSNGSGDQALVIAPWGRDISELEASLLAIRLCERTSRGRILGVVAQAGFDGASPLASSGTDPDNSVHLLELDGAVEKDDSRLSAIGAELGGAFVQADIIGGYARPLLLAGAGNS